MSDFSRENLNCQDYDTLNAVWERQLCQLGWERTWGIDGLGWRSPGDVDSPGQSLYDAWSTATETPQDLKYGIEKEPPEPKYRKPV
jgi:hypothetical protein